ncbi:unnamed protein product [Diatraea saccharalis]|uniref:Filaggrin-2-like n=1 Tax=Diatraea saccharalis TaxID=40085 RepID=A0A9N9WJJ1_9NEOP|nr:unnamed protein product [Diatraea saccharalis]
MARRIVALLLVSVASCMEMRETVERMVMVRTTGSDLQPAATGYIYKKDNNGAASVIKMGESEVMEHLSKLYEQPEAFAAPIPVAAGPFYAKEEDGIKSASRTDEHVIPVVEKSEDDHDNIDGIADEDYQKMFKDYAGDFGKYNGDYTDYLHGLGYFDHDIFHGHGGGEGYGTKGYKDHGNKGYKGYADEHHYGKGGGGDYHTEKYERYSVSGERGHKKSYGDGDAYGNHFDQGQGLKGNDHGHKELHSKSEEVDGYHKVFDKDEYKKDQDVFDGEDVKGGFGEHADGHAHHGSDNAKFAKGDAHESDHDESDFGKGGFHEQHSGAEDGAEHSSDEGGESNNQQEGGFGTENGEYDGKSYGYKIKH